MGDSGVNVQSLEREVVGSTPLPSNDPNEVSVLITGFGVRIPCLLLTWHVTNKV